MNREGRRLPAAPHPFSFLIDHRTPNEEAYSKTDEDSARRRHQVQPKSDAVQRNIRVDQPVLPHRQQGHDRRTSFQRLKLLVADDKGCRPCRFGSTLQHLRVDLEIGQNRGLTVRQSFYVYPDDTIVALNYVDGGYQTLTLSGDDAATFSHLLLAAVAEAHLTSAREAGDVAKGGRQ